MAQIILMAMALITGAMVPLQLAFNGQLGVALKGPLLATMAVFITGIVATSIALAVTRTPLPDIATLKAAPLWF